MREFYEGIYEGISNKLGRVDGSPSDTRPLLADVVVVRCAGQAS